MKERMAYQFLFSLGFLLLWGLTIHLFHLPDYILPGPLAVLKSCYHNAALLATEAVPTVIETLLGLILATCFGILCAMLMALFLPFRLWLLPILIVSQAIPTFAIAPLLVIWLGYGIASKVVTTIIMLFFPITSAFFDGLNRTTPEWLEMARIMGANRYRTLRNIQIPAALPALGTGLRVAATIAPIGAVIGEWVGASKGLGFLMLDANARMQIDLMFAALLTLIVLSLLLYYGVDRLMKAITPWEPKN